MKKLVLVLVVALAGCASSGNPTTAVEPAPTEGFELLLVPLLTEGHTRHIKYDKFTGEAWWSSDTSWVKIRDTEVLPQSVYEIKAVATGKSWRAIRIDKVSGKTWKNSRGNWVPFTNQIEQ